MLSESVGTVRLVRSTTSARAIVGTAMYRRDRDVRIEAVSIAIYMLAHTCVVKKSYFGAKLSYPNDVWDGG